MGLRWMQLGCAAMSLLALSLCAGCSRPVSGPPQEIPAPTPSVPNQLVAHIWRVEQPASGFLGTIYIFVADGTLLESSCKETYRIAKWSTESKSAQTIQVVEDGQPAFTGTIMEASPTGMRLQRRMRHGETDELKLSAATGEFVCPDLR